MADPVTAAPASTGTTSGTTGGGSAPVTTGAGLTTGTAPGTDGGEQSGAEQPAKAKYTYRKFTDHGTYADEEWDEDRVKSFLSDDHEEVYKIDGEEVRLPRHQARAYVRQGRTAFQRMEQAKKLQQDVEKQRETAAQDPYGWLDETMGYEFDGEPVAGMQVTRAERMALRTAHELYGLAELREKDLSQYIAAERARTDKLRLAREKIAGQRAEQKQRDQRGKEAAEQLRPQVIDALRGAGVEPTQDFERRVLTYLRRAQAAGYQMPLSEAAQHARNDHVQEIRAALVRHAGPALLAVLGPDIAKKIREADVSRIETAPAAQSQQPPRAEDNGTVVPRIDQMMQGRKLVSAFKR